MKDIIDTNYYLAKSVCKDFKIKKIGEYNDLSVQRDPLLVADVFNTFRNMCL